MGVSFFSCVVRILEKHTQHSPVPVKIEEAAVRVWEHGGMLATQLCKEGLRVSAQYVHRRLKHLLGKEKKIFIM
jgi:hypothetical protein